MICEFLLGADAARRLVEQEELGRAHQRHGDVEELAHALRQELRRLLAIFGDAEALDEPLGLGDELGPAQGPPQRKPRARGDAAGDEEVVEHARRREDLRHLEGARDAGDDDVARRQRGDVAPLELDRAAGRREIAGDEIDEGGLAGAVRADDADHLARCDLDLDIARGDDRAEGFVEPAHRKERAHEADRRRRRNSDQTPLGRKQMSSRRQMPSTICQL